MGPMAVVYTTKSWGDLRGIEHGDMILIMGIELLSYPHGGY